MLAKPNYPGNWCDWLVCNVCLYVLSMEIVSLPLTRFKLHTEKLLYEFLYAFKLENWKQTFTEYFQLVTPWRGNCFYEIIYELQNRGIFIAKTFTWFYQSSFRIIKRKEMLFRRIFGILNLGESFPSITSHLQLSWILFEKSFEFCLKHFLHFLVPL